MSKAKPRVCVIGAGPSGMSVLYQFNQMKAQGQEIPEIVCFEKQSDWGGLWKYNDQIGKNAGKKKYKIKKVHSVTGQTQFLAVWRSLTRPCRLAGHLVGS